MGNSKDTEKDVQKTKRPGACSQKPYFPELESHTEGRNGSNKGGNKQEEEE